jgi:hypothetical protein
MTTGAGTGVLSTPPNRQVSVTGRGLEIRARADSGEVLPWSVLPVELPPNCRPGTFTVHLAIALEWSVDVLVEYDTGGALTEVELWRVGPWGLRAEPIKLMDAASARPMRGVSMVEQLASWNGTVADGLRPLLFLLTYLDDHRIHPYHLRTDALRFRADVVALEPKNRTYDVFVSYKERDTLAFATLINSKLREAGLHTWFGPDRTYTDYRDQIKNGVKRSTHFLLILSEHSFDLPEAPVPVFGQAEPARPELVQATEIDWILDEPVDEDGRLRFLCNHSWPSAAEGNVGLRKQLTSDQWQMQTPERFGIDPVSPDWIEQYATALARRIYADVSNAPARQR